MTYEELIGLLRTFTATQLNQDVTVYLGCEYHHIRSIRVAVENGVLDEDHLVLSEEASTAPCWYFTSDSADYGSETFGPYDSKIETLLGIGRVKTRAATLGDGVVRHYSAPIHGARPPAFR
jgi:hypothetical protein